MAAAAASQSTPLATELYRAITTDPEPRRVGSVFSETLARVGRDDCVLIPGKKGLPPDYTRPIVVTSQLASATAMVKSVEGEVLVHSVAQKIFEGQFELYALFQGGCGCVIGVETVPAIVEKELSCEGEVADALERSMHQFDGELKRMSEGTGLLLVLKSLDQVYIASVGSSRAFLHQVVRGSAQTHPLNVPSDGVLGVEHERFPPISITMLTKGGELQVNKAAETAELGYGEGSFLLLGTHAFAATVGTLDLNDGLERKPDGMTDRDLMHRVIQGAVDAGCDQSNGVMSILL